MSDPDRFKFHGDQHYLKTAAEMRSLFPEVPEACDNTLWIAERCDVEIEFGKPQLPELPAARGLRRRRRLPRAPHLRGGPASAGATSCPTHVVERLAYELKVIADMGFQLVLPHRLGPHQARPRRRHPGRARAVARPPAARWPTRLRITDLDPIKYDLLFERFLNPSRISMPDIDMDFDSRYRDEMIRYAAERYGRDHVAQIVTFSTIKARAAVRDAARVLGYPYVVGDKVAKAMPPLVMGRDTPLYACLEEHPKFDDGYKMAAELREMYATDPDAKQVIDVARGLEGLRRQDGIHAAAVVITKEPLTEYLPIQRKPEAGQDPEDAPVVTQYEMHGVEELGLLKMDFLGLRNLDVITDTVDDDPARPRRSTSTSTTSPLDDDDDLRAAARGDSIGVFQLEGGPMRALMRSLAPTASRTSPPSWPCTGPGPMAANMHNDYADRKNGRKPIEYLHPDAGGAPRRHLRADDLPGVGDAGRAEVRRLLAGRGRQPPQGLRQEGSASSSPRSARSSSTAATATGYGARARQRAVRHHRAVRRLRLQQEPRLRLRLRRLPDRLPQGALPGRVPRRLLTSVKANLDKAAVYLNECRQMGIEVLVPDVNVSESDFVGVDGPRRRPGRSPSACRRCATSGEGLVALIVAEREANGPVRRLLRLLRPRRHRRCSTSAPSSRSSRPAASTPSATPARACSRVLRADHRPRRVARRRKEAEGQFDLFAMADEGQDAGAVSSTRYADPRRRVRQEPAPRLREGDARPLRVRPPADGGRGVAAAPHRVHASPSSRASRTAPMRVVGGLVTDLQRKWTKKGDLMAVFVLEDLQSSIEVMVFPKTMQQLRPPARGRRRRHRQGPGRRPRRPAQAHGHRDRALRAGHRRRPAGARQPLARPR